MTVSRLFAFDLTVPSKAWLLDLVCPSALLSLAHVLRLEQALVLGVRRLWALTGVLHQADSIPRMHVRGLQLALATVLPLHGLTQAVQALQHTSPLLVPFGKCLPGLALARPLDR